MSTRPDRTFRCDFEVCGALTCADKPHAVKLPSGVTVELRNAPLDENENIPGLIAVAIGPAPSLEEAAEAMTESVCQVLDAVAFSTQSPFKLVQPLRAIDWTPDLTERQALIYAFARESYPPLPELRDQYIDTARAICAIALPDFVSAALRYFRHGIAAEHPEEQFGRLWCSLEVLASNVNGKTKSHIPCPKCNGDMKCPNCGHEPTRLPLPTETIRLLIDKFVRKELAAEAKKVLLEARNGLMHGRTPQVIEAKCGRTFTEMVEMLGGLVWRVLMSSCRPHLGDAKRDFLRGSAQTGFARRRVRGTMHIDFLSTGRLPSEDQLPVVDLGFDQWLEHGSPVAPNARDGKHVAEHPSP